MSPLGTLRDIADSELELMRAWRNAPAVRANMYTQHEISHEEHLDWWQKTKSRTDTKYFMYEMAGKPEGIAAFTRIDMQNLNSSWAFYASPSAPRGTGSKMEFLMLEYAFGALNLNKLYCEVLSFNGAVIKLHQKFGFRIEGVFRRHHKINADFVDIYRLGILTAEWQLCRSAISDNFITKKESGL